MQNVPINICRPSVKFVALVYTFGFFFYLWCDEVESHIKCNFGRAKVTTKPLSISAGFFHRNIQLLFQFWLNQLGCFDLFFFSSLLLLHFGKNLRFKICQEKIDLLFLTHFIVCLFSMRKYLFHDNDAIKKAAIYLTINLFIAVVLIPSIYSVSFVCMIWLRAF